MKAFKSYYNRKFVLINIIVLTILSFSYLSCKEEDFEDTNIEVIDENDNSSDQNSGGKTPDIDLSHWKVTLPIGRPTEVEPPEILNYASNATIKPFMYNDKKDGSLVFYTYPANSTQNSKYSRTELREQMVAGSNATNWTFKQGGRMKGTLKMEDVSKDSRGKYHKVIVMQIHGRLTNEQRDRIGKSSNDAPPVLKIYWDKEKLRVKTKELKNPNMTGDNVLKKDSWTDDQGYKFKTPVGFKKFTVEVIASEGKLEVILNGKESVVYDGIHMEKWSVFENYFKAGNYLQTRDEGSFAKVKYYDLEVSH